MEKREVPILEDTDQPLIAALATGLGRDTARVLTYLLLRTESEAYRDAATRSEICLGTGLGRDATIAATNTLVDASLVSVASVSDALEGRERKAWHVTSSRDRLLRSVRTHHAEALLAHAGDLRDSLMPTASTMPSSTPDAELDALEVALNWDPNSVHFPLFVAEHTGTYDARDLSVEFESYQGSGAALAAVERGDAAVGIVGPATLLQAIQDGSPVFPIALLYQRSMVALYTIREVFGETFEDIAQLRGRRIGMATETETGLIVNLVLQQADLLEEVTIESTSVEERPLLLSGAVDVAVGIFIDAMALAREGYESDTMLVGDTFPFPGPAIVTTPTTFGTYRRQLTQFLAATIAGWTAGAQDPAIAQRAVPGDDIPTAPVIDRLVHEFGSSPTVTANGWGWQAIQNWERLGTALNQAAIVPEER